jgi:hypothetical protein
MVDITSYFEIFNRWHSRARSHGNMARVAHLRTQYGLTPREVRGDKAG